MFSCINFRCTESSPIFQAPSGPIHSYCNVRRAPCAVLPSLCRLCNCHPVLLMPSPFSADLSSLFSLATLGLSSVSVSLSVCLLFVASFRFKGICRINWGKDMIWSWYFYHHWSSHEGCRPEALESHMVIVLLEIPALQAVPTFISRNPTMSVDTPFIVSPPSLFYWG